MSVKLFIILNLLEKIETEILSAADNSSNTKRETKINYFI